MKAVICYERDKPLAVEEIDCDAPGRNEVRVRMAASGVCHSDLSVINGTIPSAMPILIGHEGAGVVEEIGEGVRNVAPGDHVALSFVPNCRECFFCVRGQAYLCEKAGPLNMGKQLDGTSRVFIAK